MNESILVGDYVLVKYLDGRMACGDVVSDDGETVTVSIHGLILDFREKGIAKRQCKLIHRF